MWKHVDLMFSLELIAYMLVFDNWRSSMRILPSYVLDPLINSCDNIQNKCLTWLMLSYLNSQWLVDCFESHLVILFVFGNG